MSVLQYLVGMLRLGHSAALPQPIDDDSEERIGLCVRVLTRPSAAMRLVWLQLCRQSFAAMITEKLRRDSEESKKSNALSLSQADDLIDFYHLKSRKVRGPRFPT